MRRIPYAPILLSMLLVAGAAAPRAAAQAAPAAEDPEFDPLAGENPDRYAQVKAVEGTVTIQKGEADELLTRGIPVAEGDVLESQGRGALQLADGTVVAFGADTRFRVAALFTDQGDHPCVFLTLHHGQLRVHKGADSEALIRVDTPVGSGTFRGGLERPATLPDATYTFAEGADGPRLTFLVHRGPATFRNGAGQTRVFAGQRLTVYAQDDPLDRLADFDSYALDDFDLWAGDEARLRPGPGAARMPAELRAYADDLDSSGRWLYVPDCATWCWAPTGLAADWRPYRDGRWGAYPGGMTWVSDAPWGFVTDHHGRWGWGPRLGWYWIPGTFYSPAWVAWNSSGDYFGWAPLGYYNQPCEWGQGPCWNVVEMAWIGHPGLRARYHREAAVLSAFVTPGPRPWFVGRMVATPAELHDADRFRTLAAQPALGRQRLAEYARSAQAATGRTLVRPPNPAASSQGFIRMEAPPAAPSRTFTLPRALPAAAPVATRPAQPPAPPGDRSVPGTGHAQPAPAAGRALEAPPRPNVPVERPVNRIPVEAGRTPPRTPAGERPRLEEPPRRVEEPPSRMEAHPVPRQEAPHERPAAPRPEPRPPARQEEPPAKEKK